VLAHGGVVTGWKRSSRVARGDREASAQVIAAAGRLADLPAHAARARESRDFHVPTGTPITSAPHLREAFQSRQDHRPRIPAEAHQRRLDSSAMTFP